MATYEMIKRNVNRDIATGRIETTRNSWKKKLDMFMLHDRLTPEQYDELDKLISVPEEAQAEPEAPAETK